MLPASQTRLSHLVFYTGLLLVMVFFFWSRINTSDNLYFVGDGTLIVALIEEMLKSGDWTANVGRIAHIIQVQAEWEPYAKDTPQQGGYYFNLSGYVVVATAVCNSLQVLGFDHLTIPFMLHGLNVFLQGLTLLLLFLIGRQMAGRDLGLLNMLFFTVLPLVVTEAHYERPESWLAFLSTVMLFALLKYPQIPKTSASILGAAFGFSVAVKFSQLFLGIIPFVLLCHLFLSLSEVSLLARTRRVVFYGAIIAVGATAAVVINVPFILNHLPEYFVDVSRTSGFFNTPNPMYAAEEYSYASQLMYMGNYFQGTMGVIWCLLLLSGFYLCLFPRVSGLQVPLYFRLSLIIPPAFILFYFASKYNFMERIFSATEPMLCIISGIAFYTLKVFIGRKVSQASLRAGILFLLLVLIIVKPVQLNYFFIENHIRQPGYTMRIEFQEKLKNDFQGFWIKNVHITYGFTGAIPEHPAKAPRIYHVEDFNQYWNASHKDTLENNGFILIGTYCSDFSELPPSNHTIYHSAAKNHYWVRRDEWPATVAPGYFKTNCP